MFCMEYISKRRQALNDNVRTAGNSIYNGFGDILTTPLYKELPVILSTCLVVTLIGTGIELYKDNTDLCNAKNTENRSERAKIRKRSRVLEEAPSFGFNRKLGVVRFRDKETGETHYLIEIDGKWHRCKRENPSDPKDKLVEY